MPQSATFRFADAAFDVSSSAPSDVDWLTTYLGPDFAPDAWPDAPARVVRVDLVHDPARYARLVGHLADDPRAPTLIALALNQRDVRFDCVRDEDGAEWLHDATRASFVRVDDDSVRILGDGHDERARGLLMRIVRELAIDRVLHTGGTVVHACALAAPGGVVIVAGTEGAGKTSTLLSLLALGAAGYVANDRIAVWVDHAGATGRGIPTLVGIRDGTFALLGALGPSGASAVDRIHAAARTGAPDARRTTSGKVKLTPVDVDVVFGAGTATTGGPVLGVVLPSVAVVGESSAVTVREVGPHEWTTERLLALECRRGFARDVGEVFVSDASDATAARLRESSLAVKRRLVARVPAVEVSLLPGVPISADDWARVVSTLEASARATAEASSQADGGDA